MNVILWLSRNLSAIQFLAGGFDFLVKVDYDELAGPAA